MLYTLMSGFIPTDQYEGNPGSDPHGNYILFPLELSDSLQPGNYLKTPTGQILCLKELDFVKENGNIIACKVYY